MMFTVMTYTNVNGHLIPNLTYKSGEQMEQPGKYGFLRREYLKNHRNSTCQVMLLQDTIGEHLLQVDKAAREREEAILKQLEETVVYISSSHCRFDSMVLFPAMHRKSGIINFCIRTCIVKKHSEIFRLCQTKMLIQEISMKSTNLSFSLYNVFVVQGHFPL